jgi:thiamine-monophosphate kinase
MTWGDDYELLFTLPPDITPACFAHAIGQVMKYTDNSILVDGAAPLGPLGFWHDLPGS